MPGRGVRVPIWAAKHRAFVWKFAIFTFAASALVTGGFVVFRRVEWRHFVERLRKIADLAGNWPPPLLPSLLLVGLVVILLLWKLPVLQVARSKALTDEKRFDRENEARKTLAQILAGAFVLAGLYSSVQTLNLSREGQITDRFTKAIEQLGALDGSGEPKREVRLGGIYALERIARDSARDDWVIMEVLTTYVREESPRKSDLRTDQKMIQMLKRTTAMPGDMPRVSVDIQAILNVLGRRELKYDRGRLDLHNTDLSGADLSNADLTKSNLSHVDLRGARLSKADLTSANLTNAILGAVILRDTLLVDAILNGADLTLADLSDANMTGADLDGTDLKKKDLRGG
jgi:hypothetical protein